MSTKKSSPAKRITESTVRRAPVKFVAKRIATAPKTAAKSTRPSEPQPATKQAALIGLLRAPTGATIQQMIDLTGWQAHTVRGTISGVLRKKLGLNVQSASSDAGRLYRVLPA